MGAFIEGSSDIDFIAVLQRKLTASEIATLKVVHKEMHRNLNSYWKDWKNKCKKFPSVHFAGLYFSLSSIEWGVLGVSRLYYTFLERDITSKVGAGEYALRTVPVRWHKIINESMRLRKGIAHSYYKSKKERRDDALLYMDFIFQESNKLFSNGLMK